MEWRKAVQALPAAVDDGSVALSLVWSHFACRGLMQTRGQDSVWLSRSDADPSWDYVGKRGIMWDDGLTADYADFADGTRTRFLTREFKKTWFG